MGPNNVADLEPTRTIPIALSRRPAAPFISLLTESLRDSANNPLHYVNQPKAAIEAQSDPEGGLVGPEEKGGN